MHITIPATSVSRRISISIGFRRGFAIAFTIHEGSTLMSYGFFIWAIGDGTALGFRLVG